MRLLIFITVWKRPEVTRLCYDGVNRLIKSFAEKDVDVDVLIVGSQDVHRDLAKEYKYNFFRTPNEPLGEKHNEGMRHAFTLPWDYLMHLGSDDFLDGRYVDYVVKYMKNKEPLFGLSKYYCINLNNYDTYEYTAKNNHIAGSGRLIRRDIAETTMTDSGRIWTPAKMIGLDWDSTNRMEETCDIKNTIVDIGDNVFLIDLKSPVNLNRFGVLDLQRPHINEVKFKEFTPEITVENLEKLKKDLEI